MATVVIESLQLEYRTVLDAVLANTTVNQPRGRRVYDAGYTTIEIARPDLPQLPVSTGRGINMDIAAIEAIQLISGEAKHDLVLKIAPQFEAYSDVTGNGDDGDPMVREFHGNYGGRMQPEPFHACGCDHYHFSYLECVVAKIKRDRDTRQAVVNIWDNRLDNGTPGMHDYPCTIALVLRVFKGRLDMHVMMRSNDAWLGLPFDIWQFNQWHWTAANMLGVPLGRYTHLATSMHIYEDDLEKVEKVYDRSNVANISLPRGFSHVQDAADIINGNTELSHRESASHRWYAERLAPYIHDEDENDKKE